MKISFIIQKRNGKKIYVLLHGDVCVSETSAGVLQRSCVITRIAVENVVLHQSLGLVHDLPGCQSRMITQVSYHRLHIAESVH